MHVYNERITYKTILKLLIGSNKLRIIRRLNLLVNQPSLYIYICVCVGQYIIVMVKVTT
jgi:hypothetical protein